MASDTDAPQNGEILNHFVCANQWIRNREVCMELIISFSALEGIPQSLHQMGPSNAYMGSERRQRAL